MKKTYLLVFVVLMLLGVGAGGMMPAAGVAAGLEEELVLSRQNFMDVAVEKDGMFFFLENFSKSKIEKNGFPGHRWEWVMGIQNTNSAAVTVKSYSVIFENDGREAFAGPRPQSGGPIMISPGKEEFIFLESEFWSLMPARRTGWANIFFTITIGEGNRSKDFKITIRLD